MGLLQHWAYEEDDGIRWPPTLTLEHWISGPANIRPRLRPSWCYSAPGMSRAVQLAAVALNRPDWHNLVHRSLQPLLSAPVDQWRCDDPGLCHGWAGLLHVFRRLSDYIDNPRMDAVQDDLAAKTLAQYLPRSRFGFRSTLTNTPQGSDMPGFLQGAGGTALALRAYADRTVHGDWDLPLLLS